MTANVIERGNVVKTWFIVLGAALLLLALLGTLGIEHPLGGARPAGDAAPSGPVHLDAGEMVVHWILGIATLAIAFMVKDRRTLTMIAWVFAGVYVLVGLVGFVMPVIGPWHVGTGDNLLHIVLGLANAGVAYAARDHVDTATPTRHV